MSGFTTEFEGGTCVAFLFNGVALDSRAKYIAGLIAAVPPRARAAALPRVCHHNPYLSL